MWENVLLEVVTMFQIECSGRFRNHLVNSISIVLQPFDFQVALLKLF